MPATRRVKCKRNVKQHGGGLGGVVNFTPSSFGHLVNNPLAWSTGSSCMAEPRPGMIESITPRGLPGMSQMGGRRNSRRNNRKNSRRNSRRNNRKNSRRNSRRQQGGAYGFTGITGIVGGYPGGASYPPVTSIGCTGASSVAIPASGSDGILNKVGGPLWDGPHTSGLQRGGAVLTGSPYELGLTEKTAGYSSLVPGAHGVIQTGAGTLVSVNVPTDGRIAGGACGMPPQHGGRRNSRRNRKNSRKNSRRNRRNSRKASRRNRKNSRR